MLFLFQGRDKGVRRQEGMGVECHLVGLNFNN